MPALPAALLGMRRSIQRSAPGAAPGGAAGSALDGRIARATKKIRFTTGTKKRTSRSGETPAARSRRSVRTTPVQMNGSATMSMAV